MNYSVAHTTNTTNTTNWELRTAKCEPNRTVPYRTRPPKPTQSSSLQSISKSFHGLCLIFNVIYSSTRMPHTHNTYYCGEKKNSIIQFRLEIYVTNNNYSSACTVCQTHISLQFFKWEMNISFY